MIGPSSTEHEQDSCSFQLCCTVIYQTVPSSTRADTVVANATTKKLYEQDTKTFPKCYVGRNGKRKQQKPHIQDTKTFPKCYVGRNGKRNQQKLHIQVWGSLNTQRNQGCQG